MSIIGYSLVLRPPPEVAGCRWALTAAFTETPLRAADERPASTCHTRFWWTWALLLGSCEPIELVDILGTSCDPSTRIPAFPVRNSRLWGVRRAEPGPVRDWSLSPVASNIGHDSMSMRSHESRLYSEQLLPVRPRHNGPRWRARPSVAAATIPEAMSARRKATVLFI